jgi:hypothetical protein
VGCTGIRACGHCEIRRAAGSFIAEKRLVYLPLRVQP